MNQVPDDPNYVNPKGRPFDRYGAYYPDPTPVAPPIGYKREPSLMELVQLMVRREKLRAEELEGFDGNNEDFEVDEDLDPPRTVHEFMAQAADQEFFAGQPLPPGSTGSNGVPPSDGPTDAKQPEPPPEGAGDE